MSLGHDSRADGELLFFRKTTFVVHFRIQDRYDNKRVHLGIRGTGSCRVTVKVASNPSGGRVHTKDDL